MSKKLTQPDAVDLEEGRPRAGLSLRKLGPLAFVGLTLGGLGVLAIRAAPPPLTGVSLAQARSHFAVGDEYSMLPAPLYADDHDGPELSPTSFVWSSTNPSVAAVDSTGLITALAPGSTTIGASYGEFSDSFTMTVRDWNIPEMMAQLEAIEFFGVEARGAAPPRAQRAYDERFLSTSGRDIWLELGIDLPPEANDERGLAATLSRDLIAPDGSVSIETIELTAPDSRELVITRPLVSSPAALQLGTYEVKIRRGSVVIQSASFVVQ